MTTSSSIESITPEKRRAAIQTAEKLHQAIVEWGVKRGLRAYRVVTATDSFFEIFNPNTGKISYDFPEKIKASIAKYQAELQIYADETRARDKKWAAAGRSDGAGPFSTLERQSPKWQGADSCDCNGATRSESPISATPGTVQAVGAAGGASALGGENEPHQAQKSARGVDFGS